MLQRKCLLKFIQKFERRIKGASAHRAPRMVKGARAALLQGLRPTEGCQQQWTFADFEINAPDAFVHVFISFPPQQQQRLVYSAQWMTLSSCIIIITQELMVQSVEVVLRLKQARNSTDRLCWLCCCEAEFRCCPFQSTSRICLEFPGRGAALSKMRGAWCKPLWCSGSIFNPVP